MKKVKFLLALPLAAVILTGCASVREVGTVNGVVLTDVRQRGIFTPCKTTLLGHKPEVPNEIEVLSDASGPGLIPACATAGGIAGGAALLRPARSSTSVNSVNGSNVGNDVTADNRSTVTVPPAGPGFVPPGHINNPSQNK